MYIKEKEPSLEDSYLRAFFYAGHSSTTSFFNIYKKCIFVDSLDGNTI